MASVAPSLVIVGVGPKISLSLARKFASIGWDIVLLSRNVSALEKLAEDVKTHRSSDTKVLFQKADASNPTSLIDGLNWAKEQLGGKVRAVCYNVARVHFNDLMSVTPEILEEDFKLAATGTLVTGQWFAENADTSGVPQGNYPIIFFTSGTLHKTPHPGLASLSAVKSASWNLALNFSQSLPKKDIHVAIPEIQNLVLRRGVDGTPADYRWDPDAIVDEVFMPFLGQKKELWEVERVI